MISTQQSPLDNIFMSLNCARSMIKGINQQELKSTENICLELQNSMVLSPNDDSMHSKETTASLEYLVFECTKA